MSNMHKPCDMFPLLVKPLTLLRDVALAMEFDFDNRRDLSASMTTCGRR